MDLRDPASSRRIIVGSGARLLVDLDQQIGEQDSTQVGLSEWLTLFPNPVYAPYKIKNNRNAYY